MLRRFGREKTTTTTTTATTTTTTTTAKIKQQQQQNQQQQQQQLTESYFDKLLCTECSVWSDLVSTGSTSNESSLASDVYS